MPDWLQELGDVGIKVDREKTQIKLIKTTIIIIITAATYVLFCLLGVYEIHYILIIITMVWNNSNEL